MPFCPEELSFRSPKGYGCFGKEQTSRVTTVVNCLEPEVAGYWRSIAGTVPRSETQSKAELRQI